MAKQNTKKPEPKNYFKLALKIGGFLLLGFVIFVVVAIIVTYFSYKSDKNTQIKLYNSAVARCGKDPVVIIKREKFLTSGFIYSLVSPVNPDYPISKTVIPFAFRSSKVEGYYCDINKARNAFNSSSSMSAYSKLEDDAENYSASEQLRIKDHYLTEQNAKGLRFYAPTIDISGFKVSTKRLDAPTVSYSIEYKRVKPVSDEQSADLIELRCWPNDAFVNPETYVGGTKVATNKYGGGIYLDDFGAKSAVSILPTTKCELRYSDYLSHVVARDYMASLTEIPKNVISEYNLYLLYALPSDYKIAD